jgi:ubiquinone/menaquinone biosynthesis C-methylase UbiE
MARQFPDATIIGLDISPQQKPNQIIPPNCSFVLHDIKNPLPFPANYFNFVHMRDMQSAVTFDWEIILKEINRILVPGGYVQFAEFIYKHILGTTNRLRKHVWGRHPIARLEKRFIEVHFEYPLLIIGGGTIGTNGAKTDAIT